MGVAGGTALPGTACNDNNANTINDVWGANCTCAGTAVTFDCEGVANGSALPGTACDDNNANTINDVWGANCTCAGTAVTFDCLGVANGTALPGTPCNDGDPFTVNDAWDANCNCYGFLFLVDCAGNIGGTSLPGTPCDDGDATTGNDVWSSSCNCAGIPLDCAGVPGGSAVLDDCGVCAGGSTGIEVDADVDADGLTVCEDNCSLVYNPDQADFDNDGVGDPCDNCLWVYNPEQDDTDENGVGDACDLNVGITEVAEGAGLSFHPNPSRGEVSVTCDIAGVRSFHFYNSLGALVFEAPVRQRMQLDALSMGVYTVIALDAEGRPLARSRLVRQ
jgi:hypothetical protein